MRTETASKRLRQVRRARAAIDVRPNWKEQPTHESLTGKQWQWSND
jgi:hypothetical protein